MNTQLSIMNTQLSISLILHWEHILGSPIRLLRHLPTIGDSFCIIVSLPALINLNPGGGLCI